MAEAGEEASPAPAPSAPSKAGACPDYAVLCSFLERYGAVLDLPELTFPELEEALEETKAVSRALVELHLKLMRKIGKSVTFDRWEKYLVKICQEYNSTWAWEMEKKGYLEMSVECKVGLLKHLCECQFDDNLKFKNAINEDDADSMRVQPIGRDKDGLMYWYQLDQDHNVRIYIEEQDDQDGSTWKCIVRTRNELAETVELLKAQIDPALLKKSEPQDGSSQESPNPEDEELKGESKEKSEEGTKDDVKEKVDPDDTKSTPSETSNGGKPGDKEPLKTISEIKTEPPDEEGIKTPKEESDSFKENVKPVKGDIKNEKAEAKDLKDVKGTADKLPSSQEPEHSEISVIVKRTDDHMEKPVEGPEKMKNDQQAKIPLKKRELKLTDDFDGPVKSALCKSKTPTKELLQKEEEKLDDDGTKTPAATATVSEGKQLVNGELNGDKPHKAKLDHVENSNATPRESIISTAKEENGIVEKRTSSVIKSLHELKENSKPRIPENLEKSSKDLSKDALTSSLEEASPKPSLKEASAETCKASVDPKVDEEKRESVLCVAKEKPADAVKDCKKDSESEPVKEAEVSKKAADVSTSESQDDKDISEAEKTETCSSDDKKSRDAEKQGADVSKEESESKAGDAKKKVGATAKSKAASSKKTSAAAKRSTLSQEKSADSKENDEEAREPVSSTDKAEEKKKPSETEKKTFSLRSKRRESPAVKESADTSAVSESKKPEDEKNNGKDKSSEKPSLLSRNKHKLEPLADDDNSGSESKEMTSERQKDGIKLTIRISNKRRRPELPVESMTVDEAEEENDDCIGRRLRRSPRISRPAVKVVEVKDRKPEKKLSDDEEKPAPTKPVREEKKSEKEPCQKIKQKPKQKRRARWTNSRSRRKRKSSSEDNTEDSDSDADSEEESADEEKEAAVPGEDDEPCKKCGLPNHPELILLCDSCDSGYHTACLRPPLMLIPDGEWYCPPCQHKLLCETLEEQLQNLDVVLKKKERAERRKERLVYVGISIENIIPTQETEEVPEVQEKEEKKKKKSKPLERRSTRTRKFISYRFDEFDEAIDEAIEDDVRDADGGGTDVTGTEHCTSGGGSPKSGLQGSEGVGRGKDMSNITGHRGKDIATILESERTEGKRPQRAVSRRKKRRRLNDLDSDSNLDEEESEDEFRISEGSHDEFVVSENTEESEEDQQSNDSDFGTRRPRRHYQRPVRKSTRLRKRVRKFSDDDDDDDDDDSDDDGQGSETENSSAYSDDYLDLKRRRSRRNQKRQVNYREESESDGSRKRARFGRGKEMRRILKRRFSSSESNASALSGDSDDEKPRHPKKNLLRKRIRSSNDELSEEEEEKPIRKRLNRIETDDEEEAAEDKPADSSDKLPAEDKPADSSDKLPAEDKPPSPSTVVPENTKKPCYRLESDEDDDFETVTKDGSPLDYSLVDLPSANGQSPGKTIETLIGKPSEKSQTPKDAPAAVSQAPNGTGSGQEAPVPEEDEDELLRVTDLVDYVCNSEQL